MLLSLGNEEIDDVGFIGENDSDCNSKYNIDTNRIYASGWSEWLCNVSKISNESSDIFKQLDACRCTY